MMAILAALMGDFDSATPEQHRQDDAEDVALPRLTDALEMGVKRLAGDLIAVGMLSPEKLQDLAANVGIEIGHSPPGLADDQVQSVWLLIENRGQAN